ncbi:MAG: hypothetical protein M3Q31_10940 [Actinomycetota bacterium]|nr:hypothetical protein [Actinomycetota bacterium]
MQQLRAGSAAALGVMLAQEADARLRQCSGRHPRRQAWAPASRRGRLCQPVVALPLTYVPILLVANDNAYMGRYGNGRLANGLGLFYLVVLAVVALTAIPLMVLTNVGQN